MNSEQLKVLQPESARGDFYAEEGCCLSCGVPQAVAPDLVGWTDSDSSQCYWIKQPGTPPELERALAVFDGQEVGCHRYAGRDPEIQFRVGWENCDFRDAWGASGGLSTPSREAGAPEFWTEPTFWERVWAKFTKR